MFLSISVSGVHRSWAVAAPLNLTRGLWPSPVISEHEPSPRFNYHSWIGQPCRQWDIFRLSCSQAHQMPCCYPLFLLHRRWSLGVLWFLMVYPHSFHLRVCRTTLAWERQLRCLVNVDRWFMAVLSNCPFCMEEFGKIKKDASTTTFPEPRTGFCFGFVFWWKWVNSWFDLEQSGIMRKCSTVRQYILQNKFRRTRSSDLQVTLRREP